MKDNNKDKVDNNNKNTGYDDAKQEHRTNWNKRIMLWSLSLIQERQMKIRQWKTHIQRRKAKTREEMLIMPDTNELNLQLNKTLN